ncbi:primary-amine oxidase [Singulisphaera sp. PoT]|uniref:primary-amine oxidase n=1 Tax=Singulisphaera sp. PoT TaxID=3411797 RepID=UPI003BF4A89F
MRNASAIVRVCMAGLLPSFLALVDAYSTLRAQAVDHAQHAANHADKTPARHALDSLDADEIQGAVSIVRKGKQLADTYKFVTVTLKEPAKGLVLHPHQGNSIAREAFLVLLDNATGKGYEAVVNLGTKAVTKFEALPDAVQPSITLDEFSECEEAVRKSPEFQAALKKRGVTDMSLVMVDAWSAGHYGNEPESDKGKRLVRSLSWVRSDPQDNGYARPIEGVVAVVDLNRKEVLRIEDHGVVPLPPKAGNWARPSIPTVRGDLKSYEVSQPDGPSFSQNGNEIQWQKWALRVGFNPREGLVLYTASYDGRPVFYRASIAEMVVPYADPKVSAYRKNAFDLGEYGVGMLANSLALGCDCLGTIRYFDGHMTDSKGRLITIKNAICLHEEDFGLLWKHTDWRTNQSEVRRSRRLAVSMIANVGNYDYGFYWYFYQDGTIQMEVKLTGIMNTQALKPGETARFGTEVAPRLNAPFHQHFFNARIDLDVDGEANTVQEVNTRSVPSGPDNPFDNAFDTETTPLTKEANAQRNTNLLSSRFWRIVNNARKNELGGPVGYRLCPTENTLPYARPGSAILKRAAFVTKNLWVTPFRNEERYPSGDYPNQHPGDDGLPRWTKDNRDIADTDLVLWYTFGQTHIPRIEDWPVMPVSSAGFLLRPDGFFNANPSLDVPPPPSGM